MSDKEPQAPNVLPMPASVSFETDTPTDGWWTIRVRILEEKFVDSQIIPWPKGASNKRRRYLSRYFKKFNEESFCLLLI